MHIYPRPPAARVKELLAACNLPTSDLSAGHFEHFFGCGPLKEPQGVVGVELYGTVALLRSLAVLETARGHGCGRELVRQAEKHALAHGAEALYLLTTTAEAFFASQGYARIERASLPEAIQRTKEFSALCPASSVAMVKPLSA